MDPEVGKIAPEVTEKVAETLGPSLIKKALLVLGSGKKSAKPATRDIKNRGEWERRNGSRDRRRSSIDQRLRKGFSLEFFRETGAGEFEVLELNRKTRQSLFTALVAEASRYQFSDRTSGATLAPEVIIDAALDVGWTNWSHRQESRNKAVYLLEEIAGYLMAKYNVSKIDRRKQQRRQRMPAAG